MTSNREGWLLLDGWAGRTAARVVVVGETPKRYRIRPASEKRVRLAGPRWMEVGATALVPRHAVCFTFPRNAEEV